MWTFGWNDLALYLISSFGIGLIVYLNQKKWPYRNILRLFIFFAIAVIAATTSIMLKNDIFGTLVTRSLLFEFVGVYALREERLEKIIG